MNTDTTQRDRDAALGRALRILVAAAKAGDGEVSFCPSSEPGDEWVIVEIVGIGEEPTVEVHDWGLDEAALHAAEQIGGRAASEERAR